MLTPTLKLASVGKKKMSSAAAVTGRMDANTVVLAMHVCTDASQPLEMGSACVNSVQQNSAVRQRHEGRVQCVPETTSPTMLSGQGLHGRAGHQNCRQNLETFAHSGILKTLNVVRIFMPGEEAVSRLKLCIGRLQHHFGKAFGIEWGLASASALHWAPASQFPIVFLVKNFQIPGRTTATTPRTPSTPLSSSWLFVKGRFFLAHTV